jgi:hypothetical protein
MVTSPKLRLFVLLGVVFWFTGMLIVRLAGPVVFEPNTPLMIALYIASFPMLYVSIRVASAISRVPMNQMLEPTVIMTFTAVFLDGVLIAWLPQAYGRNTGEIMRGAAWLLFGGGVGLLIAWVFSLRPEASQA